MCQTFRSYLFAAITILCLFLAMPGSSALAQGGDAGDQDSLGVGVVLFGAGADSADVENDKGRVSTATAGVVVSCPVSDLTYSATDYDWGDKTKLPFGNGSDDPWDVLHSLSLDLHHNEMVDDHWGYFLGGSVGAQWEIELADSGFLGLRGGGVYAFDKDVRLNFGLMGSVHKIGLRVFPALSLAYRSAEVEGFSATVGAPETWLRYRFDPAWLVRMGASLEGGTYRLEDESTVARKGYVDRFGVVLGAVAEWSPLQNLRVSFGPDFYLARSLTVYDKDGDKKDSYSVDPALGGSASVRWSF